MLENRNKKTTIQNLPTQAEMQEANSTFHLDLGYSDWQKAVNDHPDKINSSNLLNSYHGAEILRKEIIDLAMQKDLSIIDAVLELYAIKSASFKGDELNHFYIGFVKQITALVHHLYDSKHWIYLKNTPDLPPDVLTEISHDQLRLALKTLESMYISTDLPVIESHDDRTFN